jgi:bacillithiol biosynthesis cysteine-adding enzyme BshC
MAGRPPIVIDYGAFQEPPSRIFQDYLTWAEAVQPFYRDGQVGPWWEMDGMVRVADRATQRRSPLSRVAQALRRQQEIRGAERAAAQAARLAEPGAAVVVTGQQAVLLGGPLYVLYKALAALEVAAALEQRRGRPVVPVFWVASDDHDFAEIRSATVLDEMGQLRNFRYAPQREPIGQPASRIVLDDSIGRLMDDLARSLPVGPNRDGIVEALRVCYRPGATLADAFSRWLSRLLPELVILDPADPELKGLMAPVLARELQEGSPTSRLALEAGERLRSAGYHQQVPVRPGFLNLFVVMEGERRALAVQDGRVEVRGIGRTLDIGEAVGLLRSEPAAWSPGALLRPLAQDFMLPTAAYVGGPAEVAYHAQIGPSYEHFGILRPVLLPRPGITMVEPAQGRALEAEDLKLLDLQGDPEGLVARWAREAYPDIEAAFGRTREAIEREMATVETALGALDPTLRGAAESARGRALHQIETLHEKSMRALKKRDQTRADRLRRTRDALFPGGAFQERGLAFVSLLARHGEVLIQEIRRGMDPLARGHQVLHL